MNSTAKAAGALGGGIVFLVLFLPLLLLGASSSASSGLSDDVPAEYRADIIQAANTCDLITPPRLAAQLYAESAWDPNAVSPAGAQGLAQFMPGTWDAHGQDGDGDGVADPFNPIDAIYSMAHYMCALSDTMQTWLDQGKISGDLYDLTLAAYNAGAGSVQTYRGIPPFAETRGYIERIKEYERQFAAPAEFTGTFRPPIDGPMTVVSPYGMRIHPIFQTARLHAGVDIASPMGETQVATAAGTVTRTSVLGGCGQTVIIDHGTIEGDHYETWHCHLSGYAVSVGNTVNQGDPIGFTGSTGNSTGPHVHYQINRNDQPIDPWPFISGSN